MAKITIADVSGGYNLQLDINARLQQIEDTFNADVLWRRNIIGESNTMDASIDMNTNSIDNAGDVASTGLTVDGVDVAQNIELMGVVLQNSVDEAVAANDSFVMNTGAAVAAAEQARDDARDAETGAQTAETNAETAETNAVIAKVAAELAATTAGNDAVVIIAAHDSTALASSISATASAVTAASEAAAAVVSAGTATTQASAANISASAAAVSEAGAEADRIQTGVFEANVQAMIAALPGGAIGTGPDDAITNAAAALLLATAGGSSSHLNIVALVTPANGSTKTPTDSDFTLGEVTQFAYSAMGSFNSVNLEIPNASTVTELEDHNEIVVSKIDANGTVNITTAANVTITGHTVMSDQGVATLRRVTTAPGGDVYVSTFEPLTPSSIGPLSDAAINAGTSTTSGTVTPEQLATLVSNPNENLIINGNFEVWQRGTAQTAGVDGYGSDDRYHNQLFLSTRDVAQVAFTPGQTDVPGNPKYYSRTTYTSSGSPFQLVKKAQYVEDVAHLGGETVTLSFWAKSNSGTKDLAIEFEQFFGTAGASAEVTGIGGQGITIGTTWAKYSATVSIPSVSAKTITAGNHTKLNIWFDAAADYNARTGSLGPQSGEMDISQIKLEFGSVATDFVIDAPGETLLKCQRYGRLVGIGLQGLAHSATAMTVSQQHPVPMRTATPTLVLSGGTISFDDLPATTARASTSPPALYGTQDTNGVNLIISGFTGMTTGRLHPCITVDAIFIDAEL